jgi:O-antigen/teichoic acid export membrane protein
MFSTPICAAFYPSFTEFSTRKDWEGLRLSYHQAAQLMAVLMGGACIILIVFADTVLSAWTRDSEIVANAAPILRVLALGTLINGLIGVPYQLQLSTGWTGLTVRLNASAVITLVPALLLVAPRYGAIGAAWIWVSLNVGYLVFDIYFMHQRLLRTEKWRWYGQDVLKPILACGCVALGCRFAFPNASLAIEEIAVLITASISVALAGVLVCPLVRALLTETLFPGTQKSKTHFVSNSVREPKRK